MNSLNHIRPMLACSRNITLKDLQSLQYPLLASIKQDGIRCRIDDGVALSRSLKPLPNCHIQEWAETNGINAFDGEIIIQGLPFHEIQSWVMTEFTRLKPFVFRVFDYVSIGNLFSTRLVLMKHLHAKYTPPRTEILSQVEISSASQIRKLYRDAILKGEEGLILRSPNGKYKSGRSTFGEALSLKMKAFEDAEAIIIGCYEQQTNLNPKTKSRIGLTKRSSHKANKRPAGMLGGFSVRDERGRVFNVGSGFTELQRLQFWEQRQLLIGKQITYRFQPHGVLELPRSPIFKSIQHHA